MDCREGYEKCYLKRQRRDFPGSPVVKTLPSNAGHVGSIPGQGAKIPRASGPRKQNIKQKQYCNKFNKDFLKKLKGNVSFREMSTLKKG